MKSIKKLQEKDEQKEKKKISGSRKIIYNIILVILPFFILGLLEMSLRVFSYGDDLALFIDNPYEEFSDYKICNPQMGKKFFNKFSYTIPGNDLFLKEKKENTFRIFVLGSSTVYGFPYSNNMAFPRILHQRLEDAYPNKQIEVVNTSITAINSYSLLDFVKEMISYEPDAVLIYAGHNEFYGAMGAASNEVLSQSQSATLLHLKLLNFKTYQLIRNVISNVGGTFAGVEPSKIRGTLMKRMVANKDIVYDSKKYKIGVKQYKDNFTVILKKFKKAEIPVFYSEVVSNLKGLEPFNSVKTNNYPAAIDVFNKAQESEKNGKYMKAYEQYVEAKDLDCIRFRASEEINDIINEIGSEYGAYLIPMKSIFAEKSPHGIPGNNLFTEHVHPNSNGYFLMADAFFTKIKDSKIIADNVDLLGYRPASYYSKNWGLTLLDKLNAAHQIALLKSYWPFVKYDTTTIDHRHTYKPISVVDSLAFSIVKYKNVDIYDAHYNLAKLYLSEKKYLLAYHEFYSMIKTNPYDVKNYNEAANCLLLMSDLYSADKLLNKSLEITETFFAYYNLGEIELTKRNYNKAINDFVSAKELIDDTSDNYIKVLNKLQQSYFFNNELEKANGVLNEIRKYKPKYIAVTVNKRKTYNAHIPLPIRDYVIRTQKLIIDNKLDSALVLLNKSLKIYDCPAVNMLMGELLYKAKSKVAIKYYIKAYDKFKTTPLFLNNFCFILIINQKYNEANKCLDELKLIDPNYPSISKLEGIIRKHNS